MSNNQIKNDNALLTIQKTESFSGPLPHPDVLAKYDSIAPGLADRLVKMAETQSAHRQKLEYEVITSDMKLASRGQFLGFSISVIGLIVSGFVAIYGNAIAGSIIGAGTLASLVSVFMYGSKIKSEKLSDIRKKEKES